jgi:sugar phosphate isomerase/epimerase
MDFSVATATFYLQPLEQALAIVAEAGFQNVEIDLFWERKEWAMAQHLRNVPAKRAVQLVEQAGLKINSIHDGGGVLEDSASTTGFINPDLDRYLDAMGYAPECLVFHTPHIEGNPGEGWWERISGKIVQSLEKYRTACAITIENMPLFEGYSVPLITPEKMKTFVVENGLSVTLDTTHYAQIGTDIVEAARVLGSNIKTVHLSDFAAGRAHVFIGEGELDLRGFFDTVDKTSLSTVTLECSLSLKDNQSQELSYAEMVSRMKEARMRLEGFV